MTRSMFGWSLPPGCTHTMIEDAMGTESLCECCGEMPDDCFCPECPQCHAFGDKRCYIDNDGPGHIDCHTKHHGLKFTSRQLIGQTQLHIRDLKSQIADAESYIEWLTEDAEERKHR